MATQTLLDWMNEFTQKHGISAGAAGAVATAAESDAGIAAEYAKLGGDRALLKVLAAEDHTFLARLDKQRAEARVAHRKLLDELDFRRHMLEMDMSSAKNSPEQIRSWWSAEMQTYRSLASKIQGQGEKLDSEAGRQLKMLLAGHEESLDHYHDLAAKYERWVDQARPNEELIQKRIADATETYEAIEVRIRQTRTELDNMLELDAMTMDERIRRLRAGGTDESRTKAFHKIEIELSNFVRKTAEGMQDRTAWFDDKWNFRPNPIDWKPLEKQLALVERTDLEKLRQQGKDHERLWNKYIDAGGDEALLRKRYEAWNEQQGRRERMNNVKSIGFRDEIAGLQSRLADAQLALRETQRELKDIAASRRAKKARARQLTAGAATGELLSEREAAELKLLARDLKRSEPDVETRQQLIQVMRTPSRTSSS